MRLVTLQIGKPRAFTASGSGEWWDKDWSTGIIKASFEGPVWLGYQGIEGDGCADTRVHGGIDKAVCAYPVEHYGFWRESLGLPDLPHGAFGENFTTGGLLEGEVCVGDTFEMGETILQVSQPREPCWKPGRRWKIKDLAARILQKGYTGFYFRVLRPGSVQQGQPFKLVERPHPDWNLTLCNQIMHHRKDDLASALALSACPALSGSWKAMLHARHETSSKQASLNHCS
jgi:MOSC domain-containing protein YiiM